MTRKRSTHPEVNDLETLLLPREEHDVLWLEIPMHDVVAVTVVNGR